MKQITLSKGDIALVDDCDYDKLMQHKWYLSNGYAINEDRLKMHRLVMDAKKGEIVDHIDRNTLNNQSSNLRIVTKEENVHNQRKKINTINNYKGVHYVKHLNLFQSRCRMNGGDYYLGMYKTEIAAAYAYNKKALELSSTILLNDLSLPIEVLERMLVTDLSKPKAEKQSGCKGVYWSRSKQVWEVYTKIEGKRTYLGTSKCVEKAKSFFCG